MPHQGIDVASMQHSNGAPIDYQTAGSELTQRGGGLQPFVIVKLTEGGGYINPFAQADIAGFKAAGFAVAGYHFVRGNSSAQEQIDLIKAHLNSVDFVWLDCEVADGVTAPQYDARVAAIENAVGPNVGIYANQDFLAFMAGSQFLQTLPLWFADPSNTDPNRPRAITQTGQGSVPGIVGNVDLDTCDTVSFNVLWPPVVATTPEPTTPEPTTVIDPVDPAQPVVESAPGAEPTPEPVVTPEPTPVAEPTPVEPAPVEVPQVQGVNELLPVINDQSTDTESIKRIQGLLVAAGHNLGTTGPRGDGIDGGFGPVTLREVLLFQHQGGITADGIVGPVTWGKLLGI